MRPRYWLAGANLAAVPCTDTDFAGIAGTTATAMHIEMQQVLPAA